MVNLEDKLKKWDNPLSDSEEGVCSTAIRAVKKAIDNCQSLKCRDILVFEQGSHANKTNVRNCSDVDIAVVCRQTFYCDIPSNKCKADFGICDSNYSFNVFKSEVFNALAKEFSVSEIDYGNKSFKISHYKYNDNYIDIDVVPFFEYRQYSENGIERVGVSLVSTCGDRIVNFPKQHIENGNEKNALTNHYYKRMVRCFKSLKYDLEDDGYDVKDVKSYVLESILYNISNDVFNMDNAQKSYAGRYLRPYSAMFLNCIHNARNLLFNKSGSLFEPNDIQKIFDDKTRNPQTYIDFLDLLEQYCFK